MIYKTSWIEAISNEMDVYGDNMRYMVAIKPFSDEIPFVMLVKKPDDRPNEQVLYADRLDLASHWSNVRVLVVEDTDHFIQVRRPDAVIEAVLDVINAVRTGQPLAK